MFEFLVWFFLSWFYHGLAITAFYHRGLAHKSFKSPKWLERIMVWGAYTAFQSGPIPWVSTHRLHHQVADKPNDPHSPVHNSFWQAWIGWVREPKMSASLCRRLTIDLRSDPFYRYLGDGPMPTKVLQCFLSCILHRVVIFILFGPTAAIASALAGFVIFCAPNFINTITHMKVPGAYRRFDTPDMSHNVWWLVPFTFGEAFHNAHHANPRRTSVSHAWYEVDITYLFIVLLEKIGLAKDVVRGRR